MNIRVGLGYDIHPLAENRQLILGGIEIPHTKGLAGHSDADALIHAICDALLGALGEGDIGSRFPSKDPSFKNISSVILLEDVQKLVMSKGYSLVNLDTVIIAQAPRLGPYLPSIKARLATVLGVEKQRVNVKVKSGEGIDGIGREEAIAVQAVCLLETIPTPQPTS
jgi:2-C-methyl-D-erythritol 2,4-cyclodiphosphate synthase